MSEEIDNELEQTTEDKPIIYKETLDGILKEGSYIYINMRMDIGQVDVRSTRENIDNGSTEKLFRLCEDFSKWYNSTLDKNGNPTISDDRDVA